MDIQVGVYVCVRVTPFFGSSASLMPAGIAPSGACRYVREDMCTKGLKCRACVWDFRCLGSGA